MDHRQGHSSASAMRSPPALGPSPTPQNSPGLALIHGKMVEAVRYAGRE